MKKISLYCKENGSNKEYHAQLVEAKGGYVVNFQFGAIGQALKGGTKTPEPVSLIEADKIYTKLVKEKMGKGYSEGDHKGDYTEVNATQKKEVIILPQLLNTIEDVEEYLNDDRYLAQEKMDGERRMVLYDGVDNAIGLNKKGTEVPLPVEIVKALKGKKQMVLDGEMIGETFFVFDILLHDGHDLKSHTCVDRIFNLNLISFGKGIVIVKSAYTKSEKRDMFNALKADNKEGIVFKDRKSKYTHGRPASGGTQLKFKFYKTATFIVEGSTKGKRSVGLEVIDGKKKVFMGKVTIPPNHDVPKEGDLVEVRYLYAYRGGAVFQPVYLGKRNDSDLTDATISQIIYKENT
jgi:bifunctional non-homologous end joining protein LigD